MIPWAEQAISFGKAVILQFHQRNEEESEDDGQYIAHLKTVIYGMVSTAPDPLSKRQVQQTLLDYARDLICSILVSWRQSPCPFRSGRSPGHL